MKFILVVIISVFSFNASYSTIFRHDTDSSKYAELAKEKQFQCVGRLYKIIGDDEAEEESKDYQLGDLSLNMQGSCVLINDRYVLTAAHCVTKVKMKDTTEYLNDTTKITYFVITDEKTLPAKDFMIRYADDFYEADTIFMHMGYFESKVEGQWTNYDLCMIKLKKPVKNIRSAELYENNDEIGKRAVGVGWGHHGGAFDGILPIGNKFAGENMIDTVWAYRDGLPAALVCDFDSPTLDNCNLCGSPEPLPLEFTVSGGDSGGGLFIQSGKKWYIVGASPSGGVDVRMLDRNGYYCNSFYWVRISSLIDWISNNMIQ